MLVVLGVGVGAGVGVGVGGGDVALSLLSTFWKYNWRSPVGR